MDVISPPVVWIEGRCFRKNTVNPIFQPNASTDINTTRDQVIYKHYEDDICDMEGDENIDENLDITEVDNGLFRIVLPIPSAFFGLIIGSRGMVKKRLESETKTKINIKNNPEEIIIQGPTRKSIESVKIRIDSIIEPARQKTAFTHFVSIPLNDSKSKNGFLEFKEEVLRKCHGDRGIEENIFQIPEKLHLTLGTLVLLNQHERDTAAKILQQCKDSIIEEIFKGKPIKVQIKGIEYMNDDPAEVDVLYAKVECVDGSQKLQTLADKLVQNFMTSGLMQKQYERVKLHLTIMNTTFRRPQQQDEGGKKQPRETFDARKILKMFVDYDFAQTNVNTIHISNRHSVGKDGYYAVSSKIDLN